MLLRVKIENLNPPKWKCVSLEKHVFLPSDLFAQNGRHIGVPDCKPSPSFVIFWIFLPNNEHHNIKICPFY